MRSEWCHYVQAACSMTRRESIEIWFAAGDHEITDSQPHVSCGACLDVFILAVSGLLVLQGILVC